MGYKPKTVKGKDKKGGEESGKKRTPAQKWEDEKGIQKKKEPYKK